jgi:hypothetical protein
MLRSFLIFAAQSAEDRAGSEDNRSDDGNRDYEFRGLSQVAQYSSQFSRHQIILRVLPQSLTNTAPQLLYQNPTLKTSTSVTGKAIAHL